MNTFFHNDPAVEHRPTFRHRLATVAMIVFSLNVLALVIFLVGLWAGWFHVSLDKGDAAGQLQLQVTLNSAEVTDDVQEAAVETREAVGSLQTASELETVIGRVVEADPAGRQLTVESKDGKQVTARVNASTRIEVEGEAATLGAIQAGDQVELVHSTKDGENHAVKVQRVKKG